MSNTIDRGKEEKETDCESENENTEHMLDKVIDDLQPQDVLELAADISELRKELDKVNRRVSILERSRQLQSRDKNIKRSTGTDDTGLQARQR